MTCVFIKCDSSPQGIVGKNITISHILLIYYFCGLFWKVVTGVDDTRDERDKILEEKRKMENG